jgi:hypothetical protein
VSPARGDAGRGCGTRVWWPPLRPAHLHSGQFADLASRPQAYIDPRTKQPLTTWDRALADLDAEDARPASVARLGTIDARAVDQGQRDAEPSIRYITKYVTKDLTEHAAPRGDAQQAHFYRLHAELATLPCSPTCANWLLYGACLRSYGRPTSAERRPPPPAPSQHPHRTCMIDIPVWEVLGI